MSDNQNHQDHTIEKGSAANTNIVIDPAELSQQQIHAQLLEIMTYYMAHDPETALKQDWFRAVSIFVRGAQFYKIKHIKRYEKEQLPKFVNYLSMEFLIGRLLIKTVDSLGLTAKIIAILSEYDLTLEDLEEVEVDPGLGNGGLGRLAACFMDSMSALDIPAFGYGLRYDYGMFAQQIIDGQQIEVPDNWLLNGYMWEMHRPEVKYFIPFMVESKEETTDSSLGFKQINIIAQAYDVLISCKSGGSISRIRLWSASSAEELVLEHFNIGDYARAFNESNQARSISSVLYPDDSSGSGKRLRLKQEYFFSSASVQDILFRFVRSCSDFAELSNHQAIHLNDTHPSLAIPEFLRVLQEHYSVPWDKAWQYTRQIFSYTNHTLLPEALEVWDIDLFKNLVPQILEIIFKINEEFLNDLRSQNKYDDAFIWRVSLVAEQAHKNIRMANLAIVGSSKVNGVSKLHSQLMVDTIFKDFHAIYPDKFINITNGISHRRWLKKTNPQLSQLITSKIGDGWIVDLQQLEGLRKFANDEDFIQQIVEVKNHNKQRLADYLKRFFDFDIDTNSIFDVQIKRIHEYKRQLLNVLYVIYSYLNILEDPNANWTPRTVFISGKAASAYYMAKLIIRFINDVANLINSDQRTNKFLKMFFIPNYSVHIAEIVIPAADVSQQISMAGTEASGTSNMKFALNGALTLGTYDGANIEIREAVGHDNFFLFGNTAQQLSNIHQQGYDPLSIYNNNHNLRRVIDFIRLGSFIKGDKNRYFDLVNSLLHSDTYMLFADFDSYLHANDNLNRTYDDKFLWARKVINNICSMGTFSSDVSIRNYAKNVWQISD